MRKFAIVFAALWTAAAAFAADPAWLTSVPEAAELAKNRNELVLLDFTGSDWCGWCMKLDEEIFSRSEFIKYADKNLVLVQLDFPMHKEQPDDLKKANRDLKKKYGVNGFPTVVLMKPDGKVLWQQEGYAPGGPNLVIDAANQCRRAAGLGAPNKPDAPAPAPAQAVVAAPVARAVPPAQKAAPEPKLQGIFYSAAHATVVLDGKSCEEGGTIHGMRVIKITGEKVFVEFQGQIKTLEMK